MSQYQTLVIKYQGDTPPFDALVETKSLKVVEIANYNVFEERDRLEAKIELLEQEVKDYEYENG
jgi:hypothetical protein